MFYDNNYDNLEQWRAREKLIEAGSLESNRPRHPVEVKIGSSNVQENLYLSQQLQIRKRRCRVCIIASSFVAVCLVMTAAVVAGVFAFNRPEPPQPTPVSLLPSTNSADDVAFQHWYSNQKPQNVNYTKIIKEELMIHFKDVRRRENVSVLKRFFAYHHDHLSTCTTNADLLEYLDRVDSNKLNFYKAKLRDLKKDLPIRVLDFQDVFDVVEDWKLWYDYLVMLEHELATYDFQVREEPTPVIEDCTDLLGFLDTFQSFNFTCDEDKVQELSQILNENRNIPEVVYSGRRVEIRNKLVVMSKALRALRQVPSGQLESVYIFATRTVYWDCDFSIPEERTYLNGTNLVVIAPQWNFLQSVKVILKGSDGKSHQHVKAQRGQNGSPGNAGGNGGYFLAVGDLVGADRWLSVRLDGGDGADGQDGADGIDGVDGGTPDYDLVNPSCKTLTNQFKNGAGEVIRNYKVFATNGCGSDGMSGGVPGSGGSGGRAYYMNLQGNLTIINGSGGVAGAPGQGGRRGVGGKNGCFYQATTINGSKWNRWTWSKCGTDDMPSGTDGTAGANSDGVVLLQRDSTPAVFSDALLSFRFFARRKGGEGVLNFLNSIDKQTFVYNLTEPQSIFQEFRILDLNETKIETFQALQSRIEFFINVTTAFEYKTALKFLRSAVLGKITQLKYGSNDCLITDISAYLDIIISSIKHIDQKTLTKVDDSRPIAKESLSMKESELHGDVAKYFAELPLREDQLTKKIQSYLAYKSVLKKTDVEQRALYILVSRAMDARAVVNLLQFIGLTVDPLHRMSVQALNDEETSGSYKKLADVIASREDAKTNNLQRALNVSNIAARTFEEALAFVRSNLEANINSTVALRQRNILYLVRVLPDFTEYYGNEDIFERSCLFSRTISNSFKDMEEEVMRLLRIILQKNEFSAEYLADYYRLVSNTLLELSSWDDEDIRPSTVIDDLYELSSVLHSLDSYLGEAELTKSLTLAENQVRISSADLYDTVADLRRYIYTNMIRSQYIKAANAFRQWVFPYGDVYVDLTLDANVTADEAMLKVQELQKKVLEYKSSIANFDKNIREASFVTNSSVREFYVWSNGEVKDKLEDFFQGKKVTLRADVENIHVLNKSAIKFRTVRLELRAKRGSSKPGLTEALENFAIEMRHPGYSYYNYKGETYLIGTDPVVLWYSYKMDGKGEPETFNQVYKKLKNGDMSLSPYTTWTVQLQQLNFAASYSSLEPFTSSVDIVLVGYGSYVAEYSESDIYPRIDTTYRPIKRRLIR